MNNHLKQTTIGEKFLIFSILLLPLALISGPAIPNIIRFFIIIIGSIIFLKKINLRLFYNWYFYLFVFFCLYITIRSLFIFFEFNSSTEIVLFSLKSSFFYFSYFIYSLVIAYTILNFKFIRLYLSLIIFSVLVFLLIDAIIQSVFQYNLLGMKIWTTGRASSLFGDELILGSYTAKLLPIAMLMSFYIFKNKTFNLIYICSIIFGTLLIILSGERSSLLLWFLFNFLFLFYIKIKFKNFLIIILSVIIFIISTGVFKTSNNLFGSIYYRYVIELKYAITFDESHQFKFFSRGHTKHAEIATKMANDNIFFGQGPNMFRIKCSNPKFYVEGGCTTHPHNFYFQLFSETGIIGVSILFIYFLSLSLIYLKHVFLLFFNNKDERNARYNHFFSMLLPIYLFLWPIITTGNFFNSWINNIYFLCLGIALSYIIQNNNKKHEK